MEEALGILVRSPDGTVTARGEHRDWTYYLPRNPASFDG